MDEEMAPNRQGRDNYTAQTLYEHQQLTEQIMDDFNERANDLLEFADEPFMDPRDRKPNVLGGAEFEYKNLLRQHAQSNHGYGTTNYFEGEIKPFNNFQWIHEMITANLWNDYNEEFTSKILNNRELINRNFLFDSVEEIMASLKKETDPFARLVLQRMEANSMQSMQVALKMVRKA